LTLNEWLKMHSRVRFNSAFLLRFLLYNAFPQP